MLPKFIDKTLAEKVCCVSGSGCCQRSLFTDRKIAAPCVSWFQILSAGKSIKFIRLCMKDSEWVIDSSVSDAAQRGLVTLCISSISGWHSMVHS